MLSSSTKDSGEYMKDVTFLSHTSVRGEQGNARSTCLAGDLEEAPGFGERRGERQARGLQQSHRACPRSTLAVLVWHDEVEGPQRLGRGESDFATVSRIN